MYYSSRKRNGTTIHIRMVCAAVFALFAFGWLYWFQADTLTLSQHLLSEGQTLYKPFAASLVLIPALLIVQFIVSRIVPMHNYLHALTYVPSTLLLALLGSASIRDNHLTLSTLAVVLIILIFIIWCAFAYFLHVEKIDDITIKGATGFFSRMSWVNLFILLLQMLLVTGFGTTNAAFTYQAHAEVAIAEGDYEEALRAGEESAETSVPLTMLRIFALSKQGQLPHRLFLYPIVGEGCQLLPIGQRGTKPIFLSTDSIFVHLGARPKDDIASPYRYFDLLEADTLATPAVADYRLCLLLVDRNLEAFAKALPRYYQVDGSLPRYYREALTLYQHRHANPSVVLQHDATAEDWRDFQRLLLESRRNNDTGVTLHERYFGSYWYYFYQKN